MIRQILISTCLIGCASAGIAHAQTVESKCTDKVIIMDAPSEGLELKTIRINPLKTGMCGESQVKASVISASPAYTLDAEGQLVLPYPKPEQDTEVRVTFKSASGTTQTAKLTLKLR